MDSPLNEKLKNVKWGEFKLGDLFEITNTLSFNADKLNFGTEYDYVTRTSFNQGILQTTGFVNAENLNESGVWSLGLLQMDFFYRRKRWYAGQFVRKIIPKFDLTESSILFFSTILNQQKKVLLSVLVRNVDETFNNLQIQLPLKENALAFSNPCDNIKNIDFDFMESFIRELEEERIRELEEERIRELNAYLLATGLKDYALSSEEEKALEAFKTVKWREFEFKQIFNNIKQGRRLKKEDQKEGTIPFVMSGTTNTGVVGYISNPVASFPSNSITVDIFGNTFYRNFDFGAGDDTGVYWNDKENYSKDEMLFFTAAMGKSLFGKFDYGNKLRSSQSFDIKMQLPTKNNKPDYATMETFIKAVEKLVIKDVVLYADSKIKATKNVVKKDFEYKINEDAGLLNVAD
ncbi:MAG: restriction endonuclease subunit S [Treponema sp.]|nr:restriction endonuclease subunit S [Treponema sp.]MDY4768714.1 restriction endonuclease subunit S [Treponema sp.]